MLRPGLGPGVRGPVAQAAVAGIRLHAGKKAPVHCGRSLGHRAWGCDVARERPSLGTPEEKCVM